MTPSSPEVTTPADEPPAEPSRPSVVALVHGIRDFALWQATLIPTLEAEGFRVEAINYGRLSLLQFLVPFASFRRRAIETVWNQLRIIKQNHPDARLSVIAHSFGTYVVAQLVRQEFDIQFHRIIFCGSVVNYEFPFEQVQERFLPPIVNEVGTRDIWPALAESMTTGYGSAGTYGFRRPLVKDRWHNGARHNFFLSTEFCRRFWAPWLKRGEFVAGEQTPEEPHLWLRILSVLKIKYLVLAALVYALIASAGTISAYLQSQLDPVPVVVPDPTKIGSPEDLSVALDKIDAARAHLSHDEIKRISEDLTRRLLTTDSSLSRVTSRRMNNRMVNTLLLLNKRDLSTAWRNLPEKLDLSYLDLSKAQLNGVQFKEAFLIYTRFEDANLSDAVFKDSWIRQVDFRGASLSDTEFPGTDWFNAEGLLVDVERDIPIHYEHWYRCPPGYRGDPAGPFIQEFNDLYGVAFSNLDEEDTDALVSGWKDYAKHDGFCDAVASTAKK